MDKDNGSNPGGDDSAKNKVGDGDAAAKNAENKSADGKQGDDDGDAGKSDSRSYTQAEIDAIVQRRVNRATKDAEDKAKLSKEQLLERERDDALKQVRERDLKDEFVVETGLDLGKARKLFGLYKDDIEVDAAGKAVNMKSIVATAKKDFPELFGKAKVEGGGDGGGGKGDGKTNGGDMNAVIRRMAGRG